MTDLNRYFDQRSGYVCKSCGEFFDEWDEKSFRYHLKTKPECKEAEDQHHV